MNLGIPMFLGIQAVLGWVLFWGLDNTISTTSATNTTTNINFPIHTPTLLLSKTNIGVIYGGIAASISSISALIVF